MNLKKPEIPWSRTKTLSETVYELVEQKKIDTPQFQYLIKFYGRERLRALYKQERMKQRGASHGQSPESEEDRINDSSSEEENSDENEG